METTSEVMIKTTYLQPGTFYHIYNRGNNKENIFLTDWDYQRFLDLWSKHIEPIAESYAYCLLPNHFHFLVRIRDEENLLHNNVKSKRLENGMLTYYLSNTFSNLFNAYSKYFNIKHNRTGKLFAERFRRKEITDDFYFTTLIKYIHNNPVKHGICDDFTDYPYSSYWSLILSKPTRWKRDEVISWFGGHEYYISYHKEVEIDTDLGGWLQPPRSGIDKDSLIP